jgi:hypothetical protein
MVAAQLLPVKKHQDLLTPVGGEISRDFCRGKLFVEQR